MDIIIVVYPLVSLLLPMVRLLLQLIVTLKIQTIIRNMEQKLPLPVIHLHFIWMEVMGQVVK